MFVRTREREAEVWRRFVLPADGFVVEPRDGLFCARVVANADRVTGLFRALLGRLGDSVVVVVRDRRSQAGWEGAARRDDAIAAFGLLERLLQAHAGVEVSLHDRDSQVVLSAHLEIFVYSRREAWYYHLRGLELRRVESIAPRSWLLREGEFPPAPALGRALVAFAETLRLARSTP